MTDLVERLRRTEVDQQSTLGIPMLVNPDGPEAASTIEALSERIAGLHEMLRLGTASLTSFDGHCVRVDFPNREEAEQMFELLASLTQEPQ